jgi:membrane protein DedA with SNARE-associated domain
MSFEEVVVYLTTKQAILVYAIIIGSAFIENIFPPYPGDLFVLAGAYLAGQGDLNYIMVYLLALIGGLVGAMLLYSLGFYKGRKFFFKYNKSYFKLENMDKIARWFDKWGYSVLLASRFIPGVRSVIAITAGVGKVPVFRMTILTLISFMLWFLALVGGMYLVKSNWQKLVEIIEQFNILIIAVSGIVILVWLIIIYRRNRNNNK